MTQARINQLKNRRICASLSHVTLTGLAGVGQTGSVSLSVHGDHGDLVAGVRQKFLQDGGGGAF